MSRVAFLCLMFCVVEGGYTGYMQVLVNRLRLQTVGDRHITPRRHSPVADLRYAYAAGDHADVRCRKRNTTCALKLSFELGDHSQDIGSGNQTQETSALLGVQASLTRRHHGARLSCRCEHRDYSYTINVTFLLQDSFDGLLQLRVNSEPVRYQQPSFLKNDGYRVKCTYRTNKPISLESYTNDKDVTLAIFHGEHSTTPLAHGTINLTPNKDTYRFEVHDAQHSIRRRVFIEFVEYSFEELNDETPLLMNMSGGAVQVYRHKHRRYIYYDYQAQDTLVLRCETLRYVLNNYYIIFDGVTEYQGYVVRTLQLTAAYDNNTVSCCLKSKANDRTVRQIDILFRMNKVTTPEGVHWVQWVTAGASVATCVVVCVCVAVCVRRHNRRSTARQRAQNSQEQLCEDDAPIPAYPAQWDPKQTGPQGHSDVVYSNVSRGPQAGFTQPRARTSSDLLYADLDLPSGHGSEQTGCDESPYAEICHDVARLRLHD